MWKMCDSLWTLISLCYLLNGVILQEVEDYLSPTTTATTTLNPKGWTEHSGGRIINDNLIFNRNKSPYWLRNDIIVEKNAKLIIEPGVLIRIEPQVGITVRGTLIAVGTEDERITLTTAEETSAKTLNFPDIRLVDGPTILSGRLQLRHNGQWRSVCTNSRNWTIADMETACRQLGFQGGRFSNWYDRQMPLKPRILYEEPKCIGTESSLYNCQWMNRQIGSGVCDYHPDLGIECLPRHDQPLPYWRGIRFEYAQYRKRLTLDDTLYIPQSLSELSFINILYAGAGRDQNTTSAIHIEGLPPKMNNLQIINSAYNGINISDANGPININHCTIRYNRGYGVFINSSFGLSYLEDCVINENGGDGVRYVHAEERPEDKSDRYGYSDFCNLAISSSQTFPIQLFAEQSIFLNLDKYCDKVFTTKPGHVLTLQYLRAITDRNYSAILEIYDGSTLNHRLLTKLPIKNNTRPESITTISNRMYIKFNAQPRTNLVIFFRILSGYSKTYDLNITNSEISENIGSGIVIDNLRSQIHIHNSSISKNQHVAGVHITSGVGHINITESRISFNQGDGVNITYTGGDRNISKTSISSNQGYGIAVWLNNTKETEYFHINQTTTIQYTNIYKNLDIGVLHGNYCSRALINITGNSFKNSVNDALVILSCWRRTNILQHLQIGYNEFINNNRISLRISPALNLRAKIEYNHFRQGNFGGILIKNQPLEELNVLQNDLLIIQNYFLNNTGNFVVNLGLSPYSKQQFLLFTRNFVKNNKIDGLLKMNPRSRVVAPIVVGSNNIDIYRNIIENPDSKYEIGSHFEDQSRTINCTYNWLGYSNDEFIYQRLFHRYDRYNLAKINFIPFLIHNSNPLTNRINNNQLYVPKFIDTTNRIGGEVEGEEILIRGDYIVEKDINIRPGGKLTIEPGVILRFPSSVGMMVGGKLEARGIEPDSILFTLKEDILHLPDNETYEIDTEKNYEIETELIEIDSKIPIRLLGGVKETEGRLQVKIDDQWGTVCDYNWNIINAALVCQQLGFVLNPDDWRLERNEIPLAGLQENILLTNVQCDEYDTDITRCRSEVFNDFENSCTHDNDVGIRCYQTSWAGLRFSPLSERSNIQYITIEKAGLLDYATNSFKPALQIDFARHNFENIKIINNYYDGFGVVYADLYTDDTVNVIKNSEFSNNKGAGISLKQLSFNIYGSLIENNLIGIKHDSIVTNLQQREFAGWFQMTEDSYHYRPFTIPYDTDNNIVYIQRGETKYLITTEIIGGDDVVRSYKIRTDPGWVIGIQLLNPIENRSTETILIHDSITYNKESDVWYLKRDLSSFPTTSTSHGIILNYNSGDYSIGGTVIVLSTIRAPVQNIYNRIVKGPVPTVLIKNTKIRHNRYGLLTKYYNRYLDELGNHFLRKSNETFKLFNCDLSHNINEAFFLHSPNWDLHSSNLSEITIMINNTLITDNGRGIYQFSRDMRSSNNLFHYILQDVTIERNKGGGFDVHLPYVWKYNENFTHSIYIDNNTLVNNRKFSFIIDGHFAIINITNTKFIDNNCLNGLLSIRGMEKKLLIRNNEFSRNFGKFILEFSSNSQSEIIGDIPAFFIFNQLRSNKYSFKEYNIEQIYNQPTSVIIFNGIQKVVINRNLFSNNQLDYQLIAGIKTAKINNYLNVKENWWGTDQDQRIQQQIFDFDDWNNYAMAKYRPYLLKDDFESSYSVSFETNQTIDLNNLGGRLISDLIIPYRDQPYIIRSDLTIMPHVTLTIYPGVVLEFGANIGILVLGRLKAQGYLGSEIVMRPIQQRSMNIEDFKSFSNRNRRQLENLNVQDGIRLCEGGGCSSSDNNDKTSPRQGFLEYFNKTTLQWVPMCDSRFTERNAQVVCRELGFDSLNVFFDYDIRIEFHSNSLSRIWSWPEPLQCVGNEKKYEDCPIRLNGQQYGHRHECKWNDKFIFINCGHRNLDRRFDYWGGVRFADFEFEQQIYMNKFHDIKTHMTILNEESVMEFVRIEGAGILHNEKSPAIQAIVKSPKINYVEITKSASHGIDLISPSNTMVLLSNKIIDSLGAGINILSLTGEGKEANESSFTPLRTINIPYNLFSLVDICDTHKEIRVEERILLYYKYDNYPVNCIKIFRSAYNIKKLGFRLLQFNLFNSTTKYGIPDFIALYDGDIYNVSSKLINRITTETNNEKHMFRTSLPSLSVKLFANGASSNHGFIAEIVTLPISAVGFNRDVQHNISYSVVNVNREGAILYMTAGEVNPIVTIDKNQFRNNGEKLYGNFTTCQAAINIDVQNTRTIYFRNNLIEGNQGGLSIKADSSGSPTSLDAYIQNNLFVNNFNLPVLYVEGRKSTPYQRVYVYRNYITRNYARYYNNIILKQIISDFTFNYVKRNTGLQNLEISGFDNVRLRFYQTTTHNGFYHNYAVHRDSRSTIVAGTAGQQYLDNIFFNPDNDYEMITVNRSLFEFNSTFPMWNTKIDAVNNYWGFNTSLAVSGRIRDQSDDPRLLEVVFIPYYMNNQSILANKKCPPGWDLVGDTCYIYIGAPMTFNDARAFCQADNASMPYLVGSLNYVELYNFLKSQQEWYLYSDRVWVQHIDRINECTMFAYQRVEVDDCNRLHPFICEIDPKVSITILPLADDTITIATLISLTVALILIGIVGVFWWTKSKYRQAQRLERRNSIRQSLHSLRSVGLAPSTFSDASYRRKAAQLSSRSTDTLTKTSDYKKMITNGSLDSMEKSHYTLSIDDNQSFDIYEAHNPNPSVFTYSPTIEYHKSPNRYELAYKNEGFRDNSTFASNSRADSVQDSTNDQVPIIETNINDNINNVSYPPSEYYNTDTLPIGASDSTLNLKRGIDETNKNRNYDPSYSRERPNINNNNHNLVQELKRKLPRNDLIELPPAPDPPQSVQSPTYSEKLNTLQYSPDYSLATTTTASDDDRPQSTNLLETDFDEPLPRPTKVRAKSEVLLETNFDFIPQDNQSFNQQLSDANRSKSQPLETAM